MKKKLGRVKRSGRGFEYIEFKDLYGAACSLQQSSLATTDAIWLGCDHETRHHVTGEPCGARMHLDKKQVVALMEKLDAWIKTGSFKEQA